MNTLTIDIGNSRSKYEIWNDNGLMIHDELKSVEDVVEAIKEYSVEGVIVSSVRTDPEELTDKLKRSTDCLVVCFDEEEIKKYGSQILYKGKVGSDRIAAYLGTESLHGNKAVLVVDLGTAMTLDVADDKGRFRGGNISLGLRARTNALAAAASLLPDVGLACDYTSFGDDTVTSITSGAFNGILGEILYAGQRAGSQYNVQKIYLTGGDAAVIYEKLRQMMECRYDPYLVGRGLDRHLREFYFNNYEREINSLRENNDE